MLMERTNAAVKLILTGVIAAAGFEENNRDDL
jgi:hypothetical protein